MDQLRNKIKLFGYHEDKLIYRANPRRRTISTVYTVYISIQGFKKEVIKFVINPTKCYSSIVKTSISDLESRATNKIIKALPQMKIKNLSLEELERRVSLGHTFLALGEYTNPLGKKINMMIYSIDITDSIQYVSKDSCGIFFRSEFFNILSDGRFKIPATEYTILKSE